MSKTQKNIFLFLALIVFLTFFIYNFVHFYKPATCTEPKTCTICGKKEGAPLGHEYGAWTVTTEPDCLNEGRRERTCVRGDDVDWESVPALGHDWQEATYEEPQTCSRCGETTGNVKGYIPASELSEDWNEDRVSLGFSICPYKDLETPLIRCMSLSVRFKLYEHTNDVTGNWTLWTRDSNGNWHDSGSYYFDNLDEMQETQTIVFDFDSEPDIYSYSLALNENKNYDWQVTAGFDIKSAQVRED